MIPGIEKQRSYNIYGRQLESLLSLARILRVLGAVQNLLKTLSLGDGTSTYWPFHGVSRVDSSQFTSLKSLRLP